MKETGKRMVRGNKTLSQIKVREGGKVHVGRSVPMVNGRMTIPGRKSVSYGTRWKKKN